MITKIEQMEIDKSKIVLGGVIWWVVTYLGLDHTSITIFAILLAIDYITWIAASWLDDPSKVKSSIGIRGVIKKIAIFLVPFVIALAFRGIGQTDLTLVTVYVGMMVASEAYSIIANIVSIVTGKKIPENEAITKVLNIVLRHITNQIDKWQDKK